MILSVMTPVADIDLRLRHARAEIKRELKKSPAEAGQMRPGLCSARRDNCQALLC
jgi:hypothetical protein